MYDELVKRLRVEASYWCTNCCYRAGDCNCFAPDDRKKDCDVYTNLQAADAIEELANKLCDWCGVCHKERRRPWDCEIMWPNAPIPEVYIEPPKEE